MTVSDKPQLVADTFCQTGEGPMWHEAERKVYWVDIPNGRLLRYDPATNQHEEIYRSNESIGGYTIQADGGIVLFQDRGAIRLLKNGAVTDIVAEIPEERDSRFNDVIADPEGRVFCGTMPAGDRPGRLYRLERDGSLHVVFNDAGLSNGLGFTPDLKQVYHSDSLRRIITRSDYDRATGEFSNKQTFFELGGEPGVTDGMTVDAEGYVWCAIWDGSVLVRIDPSGNIVQRITFPAKKVSSAIFGGDDYRDIYVTTANVTGRVNEGPGAGGLFRVRPGVQGRAEFCSRIGI